MLYDTTGYPLDCPQVLWDALDEVQDSGRNKNDELVVAIAKHVDDCGVDDLTSEQVHAVAVVLNEL